MKYTEVMVPCQEVHFNNMNEVIVCHCIKTALIFNINS